MIIDESILKLIEILAWPITILILVIIFKPHFLNIARAISTLKYKGIEVDFDKDLKKAENEAKALELPPPESARYLSEFEINYRPYDRIQRIAEVSPRAAVIEAWRLVELSLNDIIKAKGIDVDPRSSLDRVVNRLINDGIISPRVKGLYRELKSIRNIAAHSRDFEVEPREAERYIDLALSLANELQLLLRNQ